jgi:hypothetical protein
MDDAGRVGSFESDCRVAADKGERTFPTDTGIRAFVDTSKVDTPEAKVRLFADLNARAEALADLGRKGNGQNEWLSKPRDSLKEILFSPFHGRGEPWNRQGKV